MRHVVTIAGSDPSGGAGLQADVKTFTVFGVFGMAVPTALTVQNTRGVFGIHPVPPALFRQQLDAIAQDIPIHGAKTGMLATDDLVHELARFLDAHPIMPLVVDPVFAAGTGRPLLTPAGIKALADEIMPRATVITPNVPEAARLSGMKIATVAEMAEAARLLGEHYRVSVLVTGGHLGGEAVDVLWHHGRLREFALPRVKAGERHGTGCTLTAALTALLTRGLSLPRSTELAKAYVWRLLKSSLSIGAGPSPLDHSLDLPDPVAAASARRRH